LGVAWCVNCQFGEKWGWSFGQAGWPVSGGELWELHGASVADLVTNGDGL